MKGPALLLVFLFVRNTSGSTVYNSGLLGIEEATNNLSFRNLDPPNETEEVHNEENTQDIDPRL